MLLAVFTGTAKPMPTEPLARAAGGDLRVDPDHAAGAVEQRAAGVAGVDRGVGLDHVEIEKSLGASIWRWTADTMPVVTVWS